MVAEEYLVIAQFKKQNGRINFENRKEENTGK